MSGVFGGRSTEEFYAGKKPNMKVCPERVRSLNGTFDIPLACADLYPQAQLGDAQVVNGNIQVFCLIHSISGIYDVNHCNQFHLQEHGVLIAHIGQQFSRTPRIPEWSCTSPWTFLYSRKEHTDESALQCAPRTSFGTDTPHFSAPSKPAANYPRVSIVQVSDSRPRALEFHVWIFAHLVQNQLKPHQDAIGVPRALGSLVRP